VGDITEYLRDGVGYVFAVFAWFLNRQVAANDKANEKLSETVEDLRCFAHELETRVAVLESQKHSYR
jgi:cell division protein FtsB